MIIAIWPKSRLSDFWYILSDPTPSRLAGMLLAGQQSTWPKLLFIANRMKIERLIEGGLLHGATGEGDIEKLAVRNERNSMHIHGEAMRSSVEPSTETEDEDERRTARKEDRRSSMLEEIKRQSSVFFDDGLVDGETGDSEEEDVVVDHDGHGNME